MSRKFGFVLSAFVAATVVGATPAHAATTITELGKLPGATSQIAVAVNNAGVAAGTATSAGNLTRAVVWDSNGVVKDLGGPTGSSVTRAKAINSQGVIAGEITLSGSTTGVRFNLDGTHTVLSPAYDAATTITGIDDTGAIYGYGYEAGPTSFRWYALRWDANGVQTYLPMPKGYLNGGITAVSPNGIATGWVAGHAGTSRTAARWNRDGSVTVLSGIPGGEDARGAGVNQYGEVIGHAVDYDGVTQAVRWNRDGSMTLLGANSGSTAINDAGVAVGTVGNRPVRWRANGDALDLGLPAGAVSGGPTSINNAGVIVGVVDGVSGQTAVKWVVS